MFLLFALLYVYLFRKKKRETNFCRQDLCVNLVACTVVGRETSRVNASPTVLAGYCETENFNLDATFWDIKIRK